MATKFYLKNESQMMQLISHTATSFEIKIWHYSLANVDINFGIQIQIRLKGIIVLSFYILKKGSFGKWGVRITLTE